MSRLAGCGTPRFSRAQPTSHERPTDGKPSLELVFDIFLAVVSVKLDKIS